MKGGEALVRRSDIHSTANVLMYIFYNQTLSQLSWLATELCTSPDLPGCLLLFHCDLIAL
jgi:hypothetical protein